jgi:predicted alpha/beta superfamily hydrolase
VLGELRAASETGLPVDPQRRHLGGHSFGGLFTLYALFRRPDAFAGYAPVSPSLWWAGEQMAELEKKAVFPPDQRLKLFVALGDKEQRSNDKGPPPVGPAPETMALITRLSARPQVSVTSMVLKDHVHGATLLGALPHMLTWANG